MDLVSVEERDRQYVWHPYSRLTKKVPFPPSIPILGGEGSFLISEGGRRIFDGISSWWVNLYGHNHPYIKMKVQEQLEKLDHVIFAGFTHAGAVTLAERLVKKYPLCDGGQKVFYSDNGSTAVEVAIKMAIQFWYNLPNGQKRPRRKLLAFNHGYHGDTFGAMSVGSRGPFNGPFSSHLFETIFIDPPVALSAHRNSVEQMRAVLKESGSDIAAFIFEPMVQGTAGMTVQDPEELDELLKLAKSHGIIIIADEVMTGFGRTGKMWAMDHVQERPDIVCLAKGLSGGIMPLGATLCSERIFQAFISDDPLHGFYHGHSYTANPIAISAALAGLDLFEQDSWQKQINEIVQCHGDFKGELERRPALFSRLKEVRQQGTILAMEMESGGEGAGYFHHLRDIMYDYFLERDLLLRPLGNVLYILPPYSTDRQTLLNTYEHIINFLTRRAP